MLAPWKKSYDQPRQHIKKQRHYFANKGLVKATVFPIVMYGCESWTIKKAELQRLDVFELWCWRRLLRVPWTAGRSIQSILKEISPEYSLEGQMLKLKLQYFGHLMWRTDSLEKILMLGKIEGRRKRGRQRIKWLHSIRVFSNESVLHIRWPKYRSFSFSISPSNEFSGLISFRIDWLDLLAVQETLKSLLQHHSSKASILQHSVFFMTLYVWHIYTWILEKP